MDHTAHYLKMLLTCSNCGYNPHKEMFPWNICGPIKNLWTLPNVGTNAYCPKCKKTFIY